MEQRVLILSITLLTLVACSNAPAASTPTTAIPVQANPPSSVSTPTTVLLAPTTPPPTAATLATAVPAPPTVARTLGNIDQLPVVYTLPEMEQVMVHQDLTYKTIAGEELKLDVYAPVGLPSDARLPAVLFIHGDPIRPGVNLKNARPFVSWGQLIAASGMIAVTFNYRLPQGSADVEDLIQYVRTNADSLQIDKDRLCEFAFSSGARVAPTAGLSADGTPEYIRCVAVYYGELSLALNRIFSLKPTAPTYFAPILLAKGGKDDNVSTDMPDLFVEQATTKGIKTELLVHPTGVHGFDVLNDDDQSREIIKKTIAFLQTHLGVQ